MKTTRSEPQGLLSRTAIVGLVLMITAGCQKENTELTAIKAVRDSVGVPATPSSTGFAKMIDVDLRQPNQAMVTVFRTLHDRMKTASLDPQFSKCPPAYQQAFREEATAAGDLADVMSRPESFKKPQTELWESWGNWWHSAMELEAVTRRYDRDARVVALLRTIHVRKSEKDSVKIVYSRVLVTGQELAAEMAKPPEKLGSNAISEKLYKMYHAILFEEGDAFADCPEDVRKAEWKLAIATREWEAFERQIAAGDPNQHLTQQEKDNIGRVLEAWFQAWNAFECTAKAYTGEAGCAATATRQGGQSSAPVSTFPNGPAYGFQPSREYQAVVNPKDGLTYVWIPPGSFLMGCSTADAACAPSEKPAHQVTLSKGFWIGQTEVTRAAYKKIEKDDVDWSPFLRQTVKTQFSANGELCHGVVTKAVHAGV